MSEEQVYRIQFVYTPCFLFHPMRLLMTGLVRARLVEEERAAEFLVDHFIKTDVVLIEGDEDGDS